MKYYFLIGCFLWFGSLLAGAVEITSVVRDFHHPDVFTYKEHLVGPSNVNKFSFKNATKQGAEKADFFLIKLKVAPSEIGSEVTLLLTFKAALEKELKKREKVVLLKKKKEAVRFYFSKGDLSSLGRVEAWKISVMKGDTVLEEHRSAGYLFDR